MFYDDRYYVTSKFSHVQLSEGFENALNITLNNDYYTTNKNKTKEFKFSFTESNVVDIKCCLPSIKYMNNEHVIKVLENKLIDMKKYVNCWYSDIERKIKFEIANGLTLTLTSIIGSFLGFGDNLTLSARITASNCINLHPMGMNIFVYCSCVEESIVGDTKSRILRIIPAGQNENKDIIHEIYQYPISYKVDANEISTITCTLRMDNGRVLPLEGGGAVWILLKFSKNGDR